MRLKTLTLVVLITLISCSKEHQQAVAIQIAFKTKAQLGEGAIWNHETQELHWVDILENRVHIFDPVRQSDRSFPTPSSPGTIVPVDSAFAMIALVDGIYKVHSKTGEISLFVPIDPGSDHRFNDGKCDPRGRIWVGSMPYSAEGRTAHLYRIEPDGQYAQVLDSITISNGLVWTRDKKTMYYIDTPTREIAAFDYDDETGSISNRRVAVHIPDTLGFPDGMTIDENDHLWVAMWDGNCVAHFDPRSGALVSTIQVPAHNVTSCAFGGPDMDTLYITTASIDMNEPELEAFPDAGSVFKAVPGVRGVASAFFKAQ